MRQRTMEVQRNIRGRSRTIKVLVEPDHPRFRASIGSGIKACLSEELRFTLCKVLAPHFDKAMEYDTDDPLVVNVGEDAYALHRDRRNPDKVMIRFYRPVN